MKIIMFSVREDEKPAVKAWEERNGVEITTIAEPLTTETVNLVKGYTGICLQQRVDIVDEEIYRRLSGFGIKQIALRTAGYDIIDLPLAKKYDLKVTNVPAYSPTSVAELVVMQALRLIRNNPIVEDQMAQGDFRWGGMIAKEINTLTVGIIGAGKIGGTTARLFKALGASVIAYDPIVKDELKDVLTYEPNQQSVLEKSDIVSIHVPLNESTNQLINSEAFTQMKPDAYLINAARGPIVDNSALIVALEQNEIAGAALDTLPNEQAFFNVDLRNQPLPDENLNALMKMNNVVITPHIGFYTTVAVQNMVDSSLGSVLSILKTGVSVNEVQ
ncbi:D-2-hydroxyacid dehydrogenase [Marinilactibacillus kalidii]|uniref:D-2-hydroxyacid dehydrogenase n=1 Tax=Marinilactibacillus kalidii TaxID=2820274 RepID=UPI001ABEAA81|nr:D-2-hydroxyacid dehydrogenase [Marinilactibacillus kalidii]